MSNKITLKFGAYLGAASVFLQITMYLFKIHLKPNVFFALLNYAVIIICIVWAIKFYKKSFDYLSLKDALKIGVGVAVAGGFITGIYNIIFTTFIEPDFLEQVLEARKEFLSNQNFDEAQIQEQMKMAKKMSSPFFTMAISIISIAFWGFVISVVAGFILKSKKPLS